MKQRLRILVIGAGPSGSAAAITLARGGQHVTLVEQSTYQQLRVGELLSPQGRPSIVRLLGDEHKKHFLTQIGVVGLWDSNVQRRFSDRQWWTLDRLSLDTALAKKAESEGSQLFTGSKVADLKRVDGQWQYKVAGELRTADWVINATGRASQVSRTLGGQVQRYDRQIALVAFLKGDCTAGPDMILETTPLGWWYAAPIDEHRAVAVFLTDSDLDRGEPRTAWQSRFDESSLVKENFGNLDTECTPIRVAAGFSLLVPSLGPGWVAIGDAASSFDPLTNLGIGRAAETGEKVAEVFLAASRSGGPPDLLSYTEEIGQEFNTHFCQLLSEYRQVRRFPHSPFWSKRRPAGADNPLRVRTRTSLDKKLIFPADQNFECSQCGKCCRSNWIADVDAVKQRDLMKTCEVSQVAKRTSLPLLRVLDDGRVATNITSTGACIFLDEDSSCSLKGTSARPTSCEQFPFLLRETPDGIVVGVSHLCTSIQENSGRKLETYSQDLLQLLANRRATVLPNNLSVSWGKGIEWKEYARLEEFLEQPGDIVDQARKLRWYLICWLDASLGEPIQLSGSVPRKELMELEQYMSCYMVIQLEESQDEAHEYQLAALINGEVVNLRRSSWRGCWRDIATLQSQDTNRWMAPLVQRFLRALVQRKFLLLHLPIFHNLLLLNTVPKLLSFYSAVHAMKRNSATIERQDYDKSVDLIELRLTAHGRLDKPMRSFFRWHLELARSQASCERIN